MALSPEMEHPVKAFGWAARDTSGHLSPFYFSRRETGDEDVRFRVLYSGICVSDLKCINDEWGGALYPMVPGHETVGVVIEVGSKVKKVKIGDKVGTGSIVASCHSCENCNSDFENYCHKKVFSFNQIHFDGTKTYGGCSDHMVVNERCVVRIPENMPLSTTAPLFCAGISVYAPLKRFKLGRPGKHIGVVGLGGLGHLCVKFAKAMGAKVTVISTSPTKKFDALEHLGADSFLISTQSDQMRLAIGTMDSIMDTVSTEHSIMSLIDLLKSHGQLVLVGVPEKSFEIHAYPLFLGGKSIVGSAIGGIKDTQEMIDFAAEHNITADIEIIPMSYVNTAMQRIAKYDVKYRFVIDIGNTLAATKP